MTLANLCSCTLTDVILFVLTNKSYHVSKGRSEVRGRGEKEECKEVFRGRIEREVFMNNGLMNYSFFQESHKGLFVLYNICLAKLLYNLAMSNIPQTIKWA